MCSFALEFGTLGWPSSSIAKGALGQEKKKQKQHTLRTTRTCHDDYHALQCAWSGTLCAITCNEFFLLILFKGACEKKLKIVAIMTIQKKKNLQCADS